jgi:hypothetical protein
VRAAAGGAAKWCMRAFAASRTTRDLARMLSREVGFRTDGARRRLGGATCRGVAVQAAETQQRKEARERFVSLQPSSCDRNPQP